MGKLQIFAVEFDNPPAAYLPGQPVTGRLLLQLTEKMTMRGIRLKALGRAYVYWTESSTTTDSDGSSRTDTTTYSAEEIYIKDFVVLVGSTDSGYRMELPAGHYCYPFQFILPANSPSSYEGGTGHVRYVIQATIDKPWKFDHEISQPFNVVGILDLNAQMPEFREPSTSNVNQQVSCCCWFGGHVTGSSRVNRRCFVPGETIVVDAELVNNTVADISATKLLLQQRLVFHATGASTREESKNLVTIERHQVIHPRGVDVWNNVSVVIPPDLPPTNLAGCKIIEVLYVLKFIVDARCTAVSLTTDIVIGNVPLYQYQQQQQQPPPSYNVITSQPLPSLPPPMYNSAGRFEQDNKLHQNEHNSHQTPGINMI